MTLTNFEKFEKELEYTRVKQEIQGFVSLI